MDEELLQFRAIIGHQGPLKATDLDGRVGNTMFKWDGRLGT